MLAVSLMTMKNHVCICFAFWNTVGKLFDSGISKQKNNYKVKQKGD